MQLGVAERILLLNILPPAEGNALFLRSVRRLRRDLSFTDREITEWKVQNAGQGVFNWDTSAAVPVDIDISGTAKEYVARCLKRVEESGGLHELLLPLFELIFPSEES